VEAIVINKIVFRNIERFTSKFVRRANTKNATGIEIQGLKEQATIIEVTPAAVSKIEKTLWLSNIPFNPKPTPNSKIDRSVESLVRKELKLRIK
jgi:hypothetical protein